jgi:hypothetical protein
MDGLFINGWHSDKAGERRWHTAIPLAWVGVSYLLLGERTFPAGHDLICDGWRFLVRVLPGALSRLTFH